MPLPKENWTSRWKDIQSETLELLFATFSLNCLKLYVKYKKSLTTTDPQLHLEADVKSEIGVVVSSNKTALLIHQMKKLSELRRARNSPDYEVFFSDLAIWIMAELADQKKSLS